MTHWLRATKDEKKGVADTLNMHPIASHASECGWRLLEVEVALVHFNHSIPERANIRTLRRHENRKALDFEHFWKCHGPLVEHGEQSAVLYQGWDVLDARTALRSLCDVHHKEVGLVPGQI